LRGTAAATFSARLTFQDVSLFFGDIEAVNEVSFDLKPGEIVCLLGPSGCGKSTLLRLAAGVERPQSGRVLLDGFEVAGPKAFVPPEKRNVGLMFQDFALFPHLTILANVVFGLRALDRATARSEARSALRRVGLEQYEASYPHELSGGEQQRVALARAMVPRPKVMLMDEPFSGLDQRLRESVRQETLGHTQGDPGKFDAGHPRSGRGHGNGRPHPAHAPGPADPAGHAGRCSTISRWMPMRRGFSATSTKSTAGSWTAVALSPLGSFPVPSAQAGPAGADHDPAARHPAGPRSATRSAGSCHAPRFLGDAIELLVYFEGLEEPLNVRVPERMRARPGDSLRFAIDHDHVLIFPARRYGPESSRPARSSRVSTATA
jgi:iron(III) transport system ATP-binding protein